MTVVRVLAVAAPPSLALAHNAIAIAFNGVTLYTSKLYTCISWLSDGQTTMFATMLSHTSPIGFARMLWQGQCVSLSSLK